MTGDVKLTERFNGYPVNQNLDPTTGLDTNQPLRDALFLNLREQPDSYLIEADFLNLGNLNKAMGRPFANKFIKMTTSIMMEELEKKTPDCLYGYRSLESDEVSFMTSGIKEEDLQEALQNAQTRIQNYVSQTELQKLVHHKPGRPAGAGIFTAFSKLSAQDNLISVRNKLQLDIGETKKSIVAQAMPTLTPEQLNNNSIHASMPDPDQFKGKNISMWLDEKNALELKPFIDGIGTDRMLLIHHLKHSSVNSSVIRLDIHNFKLLNEKLSQGAADNTFNMYENYVKETLQELKIPAAAYKTSSNTLDIICEPRNDLSHFKQTTDFNFQQILVFSGGKSLKNDVGIMAVDMPLNSRNPLVVFDEIETLKMGQGIYGISYIDIHDNHCALHFFDKNREPIITPLPAPSKKGEALSVLHAAAHCIDEKKFLEIITKPVGLASAFLFGKNFSPALIAQQQIKALIREKGASEEEILDHLDSEAEFESFFKERLPVHAKGQLVLTSPADKDIRLQEKMMSMALATNWGYIEPELGRMILESQSAARTQRLLDNKCGLAADRAKEFLEKDIRLHVVNIKDVDMRRTQTAEQILEFLSKTESYKGIELLDPAAKQAFAAIAHRDLNKTAEQSTKLGYHHITKAIEKITGSHTEIDLAHEGDIILETLGFAQEHLTEDEEILKTLEKLKQSFATTLPEPAQEPILHAEFGL